jgi:large subunit ribosomal protein L5
MTDKKDKKMISNIYKKYSEEVVTSMMDRFQYSNVMQVPMISHVSINMGIGDAKENPKKLESAIQELMI